MKINYENSLDDETLEEQLPPGIHTHTHTHTPNDYHCTYDSVCTPQQIPIIVHTIQYVLFNKY